MFTRSVSHILKPRQSYRRYKTTSNNLTTTNASTPTLNHTHNHSISSPQYQYNLLHTPRRTIVRDNKPKNVKMEDGVSNNNNTSKSHDFTHFNNKSSTENRQLYDNLDNFHNNHNPSHSKLPQYTQQTHSASSYPLPRPLIPVPPKKNPLSTRKILQDIESAEQNSRKTSNLSEPTPSSTLDYCGNNLSPKIPTGTQKITNQTSKKDELLSNKDEFLARFLSSFHRFHHLIEPPQWFIRTTNRLIMCFMAMVVAPTAGFGLYHFSALKQYYQNLTFFEQNGLENYLKHHNLNSILPTARSDITLDVRIDEELSIWSLFTSFNNVKQLEPFLLQQIITLNRIKPLAEQAIVNLNFVESKILEMLDPYRRPVDEVSFLATEAKNEIVNRNELQQKWDEYCAQLPQSSESLWDIIFNDDMNIMGMNGDVRKQLGSDNKGLYVNPNSLEVKYPPLFVMYDVPNIDNLREVYFTLEMLRGAKNTLNLILDLCENDKLKYLVGLLNSPISSDNTQINPDDHNTKINGQLTNTNTTTTLQDDSELHLHSFTFIPKKVPHLYFAASIFTSWLSNQLLININITKILQVYANSITTPEWLFQPREEREQSIDKANTNHLNNNNTQPTTTTNTPSSPQQETGMLSWGFSSLFGSSSSSTNSNGTTPADTTNETKTNELTQTNDITGKSYRNLYGILSYLSASPLSLPSQFNAIVKNNQHTNDKKIQIDQSFLRFDQKYQLDQYAGSLGNNIGFILHQYTSIMMIKYPKLMRYLGILSPTTFYDMCNQYMVISNHVDDASSVNVDEFARRKGTHYGLSKKMGSIYTNDKQPSLASSSNLTTNYEDGFDGITTRFGSFLSTFLSLFTSVRTHVLINSMIETIKQQQRTVITEGTVLHNNNAKGQNNINNNIFSKQSSLFIKKETYNIIYQTYNMRQNVLNRLMMKYSEVGQDKANEALQQKTFNQQSTPSLVKSSNKYTQSQKAYLESLLSIKNQDGGQFYTQEQIDAKMERFIALHQTDEKISHQGITPHRRDDDNSTKACDHQQEQRPISSNLHFSSTPIQLPSLPPIDTVININKLPLPDYDNGDDNKEKSNDHNEGSFANHHRNKSNKSSWFNSDSMLLARKYPSKTLFLMETYTADQLKPYLPSICHFYYRIDSSRLPLLRWVTTVLPNDDGGVTQPPERSNNNHVTSNV